MDAIVQADGVKKAFHCRDGNPERNEKQVLTGTNCSQDVIGETKCAKKTAHSYFRGGR